MWDKNSLQFVVRTYAVKNDDPYLGMVDAEPALAEVAWAETGSAGTTSYKTNGRRVLLKTADGTPIWPSDLQDEDGNSFRSAGFLGKVSYIIFDESLVTTGTVGAYFVAFTGKVTIYVSSPEFNVISNPISLRIVPPENITDISLVDDSLWPPIAGYLTMNDFAEMSGVLNKNRLTGGPLLELRFQKRI